MKVLRSSSQQILTQHQYYSNLLTGYVGGLAQSYDS